MSEIFICHTGTDTWFSLADTGYIVDGTIAENNDVDGDMESGYLAETAKLHGYKITPELAQKIYELVRNHYES